MYISNMPLPVANTTRLPLETTLDLERVGAKVISTVWLPEVSQIGYIVLQDGKQKFKTYNQVMHMAKS